MSFNNIFVGLPLTIFCSPSPTLRTCLQDQLRLLFFAQLHVLSSYRAQASRYNDRSNKNWSLLSNFIDKFNGQVVSLLNFLHFSLLNFSGAAAMLLMLLFLIFYSPLACYNVYRFVASSLFSCCPIILYIIIAYYSCVDGTEIKDTN